VRLFRLLLPLLLLAALSLGCAGKAPILKGSGSLVTLEYDIGKHSVIEVAGMGDLYLRFGEKPSLVVEMEDNLRDLFFLGDKTETLLLGMFARVAIQNTMPIRYIITMPDVQELKVSGVARAHVEEWSRDLVLVDVRGDGRLIVDRLKGTTLQVALGGSAKVDIGSLEAESLSVRLNGDSALKIEGGQARTLSMWIQGTSRLWAAGLEAVRAKLDIGNAGTARVGRTNYLDVKADGTSLVLYEGEPSVISNASKTAKVLKATPENRDLIPAP
jgi:hypothetical protein